MIEELEIGSMAAFNSEEFAEQFIPCEIVGVEDDKVTVEFFMPGSGSLTTRRIDKSQIFQEI